MATNRQQNLDRGCKELERESREVGGYGLVATEWDFTFKTTNAP